jgi:signal transduction histidine kinase/CheY-like chemotaxis protein
VKAHATEQVKGRLGAEGKRLQAALAAARSELRVLRRQLQCVKQEYEAKAQKLAEAKDAAEAANQAKSAFLANLSHEIRTPMNAILGYAQILQRSPDLSPKHRTAVETIEKSGTHLLALINDVLDLSKIEAGRMELQMSDFDLNALIYDLSAMFDVRCEQKKLRWLAEIWHPPGVLWERAAAPVSADEASAGTPKPAPAHAPPDPERDLAALRIMVHGDPGKLRQALINLLSNALKFTEAGEVVLRVTLPPTGQEAGPGTPQYLFEVTDTGIGIPQETQRELFQPFRQGASGVQAGGTGLGLVIAKRQIALMGGDLRLESTPGVGSRFFFSLPLASPKGTEAEPTGKRQVRHLVPGHRIGVLVVDDVVENREVLSRLLTEIGCRVSTADSGLHALEQLRRELPDLIFMDIRMPGMDGLEAAGRILAEFGRDRLKIVALSASVLAHEQQKYLASGFDDFVAKPFRLEVICECMARLLPVRFDYEIVPERKRGPSAPQDFYKLKMPQPLRQRLRAAAEVYSTTELKRCLSEVSRLGPDGQRLAAIILELVHSYDMDAILRILEETPGQEGARP